MPTYENVFQIFNRNRSPLLIKEITLQEYFGSEVVNERTWNDIPLVQPYEDSMKCLTNISTSQFDNIRINQRWTAKIEYQNESYITAEYASCYYTPDDEESDKETVMTVDMMKERFIVSPPVSKGTVAKLVKDRPHKSSREQEAEHRSLSPSTESASLPPSTESISLPPSTESTSLTSSTVPPVL